MYIPNAVQESVRLDLSLLDFRSDARPHSEEELKKLANSMAGSRQFQCIIVCRNGDRYEVIAGVGRVLAARMLGWGDIRADVYEDLTEAQRLSVMFDENEDRENPPALYQAKVIQSIIQEHGINELTQRDIAEKIGKDQVTISKYMSLLKLSPKIWENYSQCIKLGTNHFAQILRIENADDQWKLTETTLEKDLSAEELKKIVDKKLGLSKGGRPKGKKTLGKGDFRFSLRGQTLRIQALFDLTADPQAFLTKFGSGLQSWLETHPLKAKATSPDPGPTTPPFDSSADGPKVEVPSSTSGNQN